MDLPLYLLSESESESDTKDHDPIFNTRNLQSKDTDNKKAENSSVLLQVNARNRKTKEKLKTNAKKNIKRSEIIKSIKPRDCMQYISIVIDPQLLSQKFAGELLTALQSAKVKYDVREQIIPSSISWISKLQESGQKLESKTAILWTWEEFVRLMETDTFSLQIKEHIKPIVDHKITLIIFGIEDYFRTRNKLKKWEIKANVVNEVQTFDKLNRKGNCLQNLPTFSRMDIEMALAELQLLLDLQYKFIENGEELGLFITQFSRAVAELPYKLERNKRQDCTRWFANADSKDCVRINNDGNGLLRLWQQQLCQFPAVGLDVAQAIVSSFNSPQTLIEAYNKCSVQKEGELLLQNIPIRRVQGPLTSVRRIGPELSKKIYTFFNNKDGNTLL